MTQGAAARVLMPSLAVLGMGMSGAQPVTEAMTHRGLALLREQASDKSKTNDGKKEAQHTARWMS